MGAHSIMLKDLFDPLAEIMALPTVDRAFAGLRAEFEDELGERLSEP